MDGVLGGNTLVRNDAYIRIKIKRHICGFNVRFIITMWREERNKAMKKEKLSVRELRLESS